MTDIRELARRAAEAREREHSMGMSNTPTDPDERLASAAAYKIARDAYARAEAEYQDALSKLSTEELMRLAG